MSPDDLPAARPSAPPRSPLRAALTSPAVLLRLPPRTWRWLGLYVLAGSVLIALAMTLWKLFEEDVHAAVTAYLLPDSMLSIGRWVFRQLLAGQSHSLMVTATVTSASLLASLLLFRLKWRIATSLADAEALVPDAPNELRASVEIWEEVKLAACFISLQGALFWLGYFEVPALKVTAEVLTYALLFATWAINFVAPLLQRHGGFYTQTARLLLGHPLTALVFGALFSLPVVAAGLVWKANPQWDRPTAICVLFFATLLCTAAAQACGTRVATALFARFRQTRRPRPWGRVLLWTFFALVLGGCGWLFTNVVLSAHHKSQLLKCNYSVDLLSARAELPSIRELFDGKLTVGASVKLAIANPTAFDVEVEENRVEITHGKEVLATTRITPFKVAAGQAVKRRIAFQLSTDASAIFDKGRALFKSGWTITLYLKVASGFELPVYLLK